MIDLQITTALAKANGRARERLLGAREIAQVLTEAMREGYGYTTGGTVAKAYSKKGTAYSTMAFAVANGPDFIALAITRMPSMGSPVTWAGPNNKSDQSIRKWVERQTLYTLRDWMIFTRPECRLWIRSLAKVQVGDVPHDLFVTLDDSLRAGNCERESRRVAEWFKPEKAVAAVKLVKVVSRREPLLLTYVQRAIAQAKQRTEVSK